MMAKPVRRRAPDPHGHADIKTTLRYIDVNEEDKCDAIAVVFGGRARQVQAGSREDRVTGPK